MEGDFRSCLESKHFYSFSEFKKALDAFMEKHSVLFKIRSSKLCTTRLRYRFIRYDCYRHDAKESAGHGKRQTYTRATKCPAKIFVRGNGSYLYISSSNLDHNHDNDPFVFRMLPENRRLTSLELEMTEDLFLYNAPTNSIKEFVFKNFRKTLTTMDICNIRRRVKPILIRNVRSILNRLITEGLVKTFQNDAGKYTHICFARHEQRQLFRKFPHVINVDATYRTNRENYKLYQFLVTDGMGVGRPVMYAFVATETFTSLKKLFEAFVELMGDTTEIRTVVMDKMLTQMRAVEVVLGCEIHLCYFHVRQAIRRHAHYSVSRSLFHRMAICESSDEFNKHLSALRRVDPRFAHYLVTNWLPITRKWAMHAQCDLLLLGNRTNNRIENANGRLKRVTHPRDGLGVAIQKIWLHSANLISEYSQLASYQSERRLVLHTPTYVRHILDRLTTYAAKQVLAHLRKKSLNLRALFISNKQINVREGSRILTVNLDDGECSCVFYKTNWLPCVHILSAMKRSPEFPVPIRERWTAAFNVPLETVNQYLPITPKTSDECSWLESRMWSLWTRIRRSCGDECLPLFRRIVDDLEAFESSLLIMNSTEKTIKGHQPRWRKRPLPVDMSPESPSCSPSTSWAQTQGDKCIEDSISPNRKRIRGTPHSRLIAEDLLPESPSCSPSTSWAQTQGDECTEDSIAPNRKRIRVTLYSPDLTD